MKRILLIILLTLIIPQVTLAAWWNPISWFGGWSFLHRNNDDKTQVLENRIQELEKKLGESSIATSTGTTTTDRAIENTRPNITPSVKPKEDTKPAISKPTGIINNETLYKTLVADYEKFVSQIENDIVNFKNNPGADLLINKKRLVYVNTFLGDLEYKVRGVKLLVSSPLTSGIIKIYRDKLIQLQDSYRSTLSNYEDEEAESINNQLNAAKQAEIDAAAEKLQYVKDIKVKIAEMDQLKVQIETLAGSSLLGILNSAHKLDGSSLFYSFKYTCGWSQCSFDYPYTDSNYDNSNSPVRSGLHAIVNNYRAFLSVELAKNQ